MGVTEIDVGEGKVPAREGKREVRVVGASSTTEPVASAVDDGDRIFVCGDGDGHVWMAVEPGPSSPVTV
ncbi:hypothetical protein ACFSQQ_38280 [Mesorhizobium kowhaii]|uniref:hypothetical protein n=1 Tax=Mesorhizobium kowhaii TaxID=1300272 RepID=UPI00362A4939